MDTGNLSSSVPGIGLRKRRACVSCTSAKAKCTRRAGERDCERCARLGKGCHFLDMPQRRRRQNGTRRIEGLESRLEDLVTRVSTLDKDKSPISASTLSTSGPLTVPLEREPPAPQTYTPRPSVDTRIRSSLAPPISAPPPSSTTGGYADLIDRRIISPQYADSLLADFILHYAAFFPFVVWDNTVDANRLRQDSPLLFLVVMSVSLRSDPSLQRLLGEEIKAQISSTLIGRGERSLQALQALLLYLAWHYCFCWPNEERDMFAMMQLCVAMVYDLNIDKGSSASLARKRALLGVYWLSAGWSRALRRPQVIQMSRYMEYCCRQLATAGEHHTDKLIEPLVLLASLAARVGETFSYFDVEYTLVRGDSAVSTITDGFLHELQLIKRLAAAAAGDSRTDPVENTIVNMEIDYTESYILEVAVHHELWEAVPHRPPAEPSLTPPRTAMLWQAVKSNKEFVQKYITLHDSTVRCVPYTVFWRLCYVLASLIRLTFTLAESTIVSDHRWASATETSGENSSRQSAQRIADEIDLTQIIINLAAKFESAAQQVPFAGGAGGGSNIRTNDNLSPFITKLKKLAVAYSKKLSNAIGGDTHNNNGTGIETELMQDCQLPVNSQESHPRGRHAQSLREQPDHNTQIAAVAGGTRARSDERVDDSAEGNFQMLDWALSDELPWLESIGEEWDAIMQDFKIPL